MLQTHNISNANTNNFTITGDLSSKGLCLTIKTNSIQTQNPNIDRNIISTLSLTLTPTPTCLKQNQRQKQPQNNNNNNNKNNNKNNNNNNIRCQPQPQSQSQSQPQPQPISIPIPIPITLITNISSLACLQKLSQWFEDLQQFYQYIKKSQNVQLDIQNLLLIVKTRVSSRKNKAVPIAYIPLTILQQKQQETARKVLQRIIIRCSEDKQLSGQEMRNIGKQLAQVSNQIINIIDERQYQSKFNNFENQANQRFEGNLVVKMGEFEIKLVDVQKKIMEIRQNQQIKLENHQDNDHKIAIEQIEPQQRNQGIIQKNNPQKVSQISINQTLHQKFTQMLAELQHKMSTKIQEATTSLVNDQQFKVVINKLTFLGNEVQTLQNESQTLKKQYHKKQKQQETNNAYLQGDKALKWINPQCKGFPYLKTQGSTITAKGLSFVIGKHKLIGSCTFKILVKEMDSWIAAGIIDSSYYNRCQVNGLPNIIRYASNGTLLTGEQNITRGRGFSENQILTVNVDIDHGIIQWKVEEQVRCRVQDKRVFCNNMKGVQWVGYVYLRRKGDQIVLL